MVSIEDRIEILKEQHRELDSKIKYAHSHFEGNQRINFLKKSKLKIKDEITRMLKAINNDEQKLFDKSNVVYRDGDNT